MLKLSRRNKANSFWFLWILRPSAKDKATQCCIKLKRSMMSISTESMKEIGWKVCTYRPKLAVYLVTLSQSQGHWRSYKMEEVESHIKCKRLTVPISMAGMTEFGGKACTYCPSLLQHRMNRWTACQLYKSWPVRWMDMTIYIDPYATHIDTTSANDK